MERIRPSQYKATQVEQILLFNKEDAIPPRVIEPPGSLKMEFTCRFCGYFIGFDNKVAGANYCANCGQRIMHCPTGGGCLGWHADTADRAWEELVRRDRL